MPGNPRECRERALACMELARTAKSPQHKRLLTDLAQSWINFAAEIERVHTLLKTDGADPASGSAAASGITPEPSIKTH
jgi:hypothetical protein